MPQILFLPDGRSVEASISESILSASLRAGIPHTNECRGNARCSTCRVLVLNGLEFCCPRNEKEQALAAQLHFPERVRLACQTTILGNVAVRRLILDANGAGFVASFLWSVTVLREIRDQVHVGRSIDVNLSGKTGTYTLHEIVGVRNGALQTAG
jgi:ferredoxin